MVELERMRALYQQHYQGFTIKHFHEKLEQRHDYKLRYTTTRLYLQKTGVVQPAPKRCAHRRKRPRRPLRGMMLHQDGSKHAWLAGQPALDLIITMDDATSELYSAFLVAEEGTLSSLRGLVEVIARHGLFMELYSDRGSHYFFTPEAGGKVSKTQLTQVGRALKQLGIGHLAAYSPEARGRCERAFRHPPGPPAQGAGAGRDHHGRGRQPLHPRGLPARPQRSLSPCRAEEPAAAFVVVPEALWRDVLAIQEERVVGNDNCARAARNSRSRRGPLREDTPDSGG